MSVESVATIGGDLVSGAGSTTVRGNITGNLFAGSGEARISGMVGGSADLSVDRLVLKPSARIQSNLTYTSGDEAEIASGAAVLGTIIREVPTVSVLGVDLRATTGTRVLAAIVHRVQWILGTVVVGLALLWLLPTTIRAARDTVHSPWKTIGLGLLLLLLVPIGVIIIAIIAVFISGFSGFPLAGVPLALYLVLLTLTAPVIGLVLGRVILGRLIPNGRASAWHDLLLGVAILAVLGFIPYVDDITAVLTLLFGFGAWWLMAFRQYRGMRATGQV